MAKIFDFPLYYNLIRRYIVFAFRQFYGEIVIIGRENIPADGSFIFAPNHLNALMDALAIQSISPKNLPIVFLAKADIFNQKWIAKVLRLCKIMPAYRMRDGIEQLGKNKLIFEQCVETLVNHKVLGIMPEGNQGEQRMLRPLGKGLMRIALAAQQKMGNDTQVKIVPVGIDFGDLINFGTHIIINIGKPIEVVDYIEEYENNPIAATNQLRDKLRDELINLTVNLDSKNHYDCFEMAMSISNKSMVENPKLKHETLTLFYTRQKIAKKLVSLERENPLAINHLQSLCKDHSSSLKKIGLQHSVLDNPLPNFWKLMLQSFVLLLSFPLFVLGFLFNFLPFFATSISRKCLNVNYIGFYSSVDFAIAGILFPVFYLIQITVIWSVLNPHWLVLIAFIIIQFILGKFSWKWHVRLKNFIQTIKFRQLLKTNSVDIDRIKACRNQINTIFNDN